MDLLLHSWGGGGVAGGSGHKTWSDCNEDPAGGAVGLSQGAEGSELFILGKYTWMLQGCDKNKFLPEGYLNPFIIKTKTKNMPIVYFEFCICFFLVTEGVLWEKT